MTSEVTGNMLSRMVRASCFDKNLFEDVEADRSATMQALFVVAIVALSTGIASLAKTGLLGLLVGVLVGIVGWAIWAYIVYLIGTKLLGGVSKDCRFRPIPRYFQSVVHSARRWRYYFRGRITLDAYYNSYSRTPGTRLHINAKGNWSRPVGFHTLCDIHDSPIDHFRAG